MKTLLLVAHGSRQAQSNEQVLGLVEAVRLRAGDRFGCVAHAFLQFAAPGFEDAVAECVSAGATRIIVLPYLLSPGSHVNQDIPELVTSARRKYPSIAIETVPYVGASSNMPELLLGLADPS